MEKIKQIHLQIQLCLGKQKPQSAENGIKWLLGQYYTLHTVTDTLFEFHFRDYFINSLKCRKIRVIHLNRGILATEGPKEPKLKSND